MSHREANGFTLVIRGDAAALSPNRRMHWRQRHEIESHWKQSAWGEWVSLGCPYLPGKVRVSFIIYRGRVLDHCNLHGSGCLRAAINGLKQKAFVDDDPQHLEWGNVQQVTGKEHRQCPVLLMQVEKAEEESSADEPKRQTVK
jgi:hypothetical protein